MEQPLAQQSALDPTKPAILVHVQGSWGQFGMGATLTRSIFHGHYPLWFSCLKDFVAKYEAYWFCLSTVWKMQNGTVYIVQGDILL